MPTTDFSISDPTFVQFDYNGWPDAEKDRLETSARALPGVTEVNRAGARSSIHVHFDPAVINRDNLILAVNQVAQPILARLRGGSQLSSSDEPTADSDTVTSDSMEVHALEADDLTTGPPELGQATLQVHDAVSASTSSSPDLTTHNVVRSSGWTGRKPLSEQIEAVRSYAPLALAGLDELASAIEDKRYNDEATQDALRILKELRAAIDELIHAAEAGQPLTGLWKAIESRTNDLVAAAMSGAKIMVAAPIIGLGASYAISLLTGADITGQMVATIAGGSVVAGAVTNVKKT